MNREGIEYESRLVWVVLEEIAKVRSGVKVLFECAINEEEFIFWSVIVEIVFLQYLSGVYHIRFAS